MSYVPSSQYFWEDTHLEKIQYTFLHIWTKIHVQLKYVQYVLLLSYFLGKYIHSTHEDLCLSLIIISMQVIQV